MSRVPFTVNLPHVDRPASPRKALVADRRLYLADDSATVVEAGDARARFLLAAKGHAVPAADADRLHLAIVDGRVVQQPMTATSTSGASVDEGKQQTPSEHKAPLPDGDKSDKTPRAKK